jgi:hypothetical protein
MDSLAEKDNERFLTEERKNRGSALLISKISGEHFTMPYIALERKMKFQTKTENEDDQQSEQC